MLTPAERLSLDAAGHGLYATLHRDSLDEVIRDVREAHVSAVVVSVARCTYGEASRVARIVREFPRVPAIALVSGAASPHAVLSLGRSGVRTLVDVRTPEGWRQLRTVLADGRWAAEAARMALDRLARDLPGVSHPLWTFFDALFTAPPAVSTALGLCRILGVPPIRFASQFRRSGLPSPRRYLNAARLTRAARLLENPGLSIANVANRLQYSSPQSFGRHVHLTLGIPATAFRREYDGERMVERFRRELVAPHRDVLLRFDPR